MKIIRLSTYLDFGGLERRLENISWVQDSNEWIFVFFDKEGEAAKQISKNGKTIVNLNTKPSIYSLLTLIRTYRYLKKVKPDVIHTSGAEANFHGIIAGWLANVPKIIGEEIGIPNHSIIGRFIFHFVYKFASNVIGNSQQVIDAVHKLDGVAYEKMIKIFNPIIFRELESLSKYPFLQNTFNIISVSRLEKVKNIEGVLRCIKELVDEQINVHYYIIGIGASESELKSLVHHLRISSNVTFLGYQQTPTSYLQFADLYVINSFTEGFSNSLIEAMYCKVPSLSTRVGAAEEIITDGINGFLVQPNNDSELMQKLKALVYMNTDEIKYIGEMGYETVKRKFSLQMHLESLMKIYKRD